MRVVAYCRVSTDKEDQHNSFENQIRYFKRYIESNPEWKLVKIYADEGITGTSTEKRTEFLQMIRDAEAGNFDLVLTKEISRFARNTKDSLEYTRHLKKLNIGVYFLEDNINTHDKDGELRLTIMSALAQEESRRTSERVKWGQKRRMEQGVVFGRELLGYNLNKGVLTVNKEEAEIVKLIFHKYTVEGKGTHIIAKELYEQGYKPKRSDRWSNSTILKILRNEKYVGDLAQRKTYTPDYLDHRKKYNKGEEKLIYIKDHHEPIIDRELWEKTQKELQKRTSTPERKIKYSNRYWCSGKLICGECGRKFICRTKKLKNGQVYKAWRCFEAANRGSKKTDGQGNEIGCNNGSINHIVLGMIVTNVLRKINFDKDIIINETVNKLEKVQKSQKLKSTKALLRSIDNIRSKKLKLIDRMLEGTISKEDAKLMSEKYDNEISSLISEIDRIENINKIHKKQAENFQLCANRIKELVDEVNNEEVWKDTVDKIVIKNDTLRIYLNCLTFPVEVRYTSKGRYCKYQIDIKYVDMPFG